MAAQPDRRLYVIATSHLDTQWRWTFRDTIQRHLPATLRENFELFRKHPHYNFNFEGAFRYMLAKEYRPDLYEELKGWIATDRWHICGASVDAGDVNTVSPESLIRQILYGNGFFKREFGKVSRDIFLPDCFGFGWALPSIAAHCGLKSFSTSKLEWGSSEGIPFNIGCWEGVNGEGLVACINPGQYSFGLKDDWLNKEEWLARIDKVGEQSGAYVDFKYFGLGDTGGAPDPQSVIYLGWSIEAETPVTVVSAAADELALSLTEEQIAKLPRHETEFLLIEHGVGTYTSHCEMKRWNRMNECLADAAEKASVVAEWLGAARYPREKLADAWIRVLANQMHDILPGTSVPEAYELSWNDEVLSLNQFASVLRDAVGGVSRLLDTSGDGTPVVVYNPLSTERTETLLLPADRIPDHADGNVIIDAETGLFAGVVSGVAEQAVLMINATVPPLGMKVFRILKETETSTGFSVSRVAAGDSSEVHPSKRTFEDVISIVPQPGDSDVHPGQRYDVRLNNEGNVASIFDRKAERELLSAPIQLQLLDHGPKEWPAWTITHNDISEPPRSVVAGRIEEDGSVMHEGSRFKSCVRFVQIAWGEAIEIEWDIDWRTSGTLLKAAFPFAASNPKAVYDLGLGVIERGNNHEKLHEVPAQQWAHVTDKSGEFGVSIMTDSKYGWDKPDDNTLRLTLVHSPRMTGFKCHLGGANYTDHFLEQEQLDFGPHRVRVRMMGTPGDWRAGKAVWQAAALNQPLLAFVTNRHEGPLGRSFSFANMNSDAVAIKALKKAEESDEYVVRLQELEGCEQEGIRLSLGRGIASARELNGSEEHLRNIETAGDGILALDFRPFGIRTVAVRLKPAADSGNTPVCRHVDLPFNCRGISTNANRQDGNIDGLGNSLPSEQLPDVVESEGITFKTGPRRYRQLNVVICRGQKRELPDGDWTHLYALAAAIESRRESTILIGEREERFRVPGYTGFIGQWHNRVVDGAYETDPAKYRPAFIRYADVAWCCSHRHNGGTNSDEAYQYTYLFKLGWKLNGERTVTLPDDTGLRVLSLTVARNANDNVHPVKPLYD